MQDIKIQTPFGDAIVVASPERDGHWSVALVADNGEPIGVITTVLPWARKALQPDEVHAKTYSENEPLRQPMLDSGLVIDTGRRVQTGHAQAEVWRLTPAFFAAFDTTRRAA